MSRSGYSYECDDQWAHIRWRGAVASALRGKRGQAFLREILAALDAMPEKRLIGSRFEADGDCCTLGAVCRARGVDASGLTPDDDYQSNVSDEIARVLGIPRSLAAEIMWENDEMIDETRWVYPPTPEPSEIAVFNGRFNGQVEIGVSDAAKRRWKHMRDWVARHIIDPEAA